MVITSKRVNNINILKIIFGEESYQQFYVDGSINIDVKQLMEKFDSDPSVKNILSFSFCEREDSLVDYLKLYSPTDSSFINSAVSANDSDIKNVASSPQYDESVRNDIQQGHNHKCPICGDYALIDHKGNIKECEACMKINAYTKGKESALKQLKEEKAKKSKKSKKENKDVESQKD